MKHERICAWIAACLIAAGCSKQDSSHTGQAGDTTQVGASTAMIDTIGRGPWRWVATVTSTARIACDNPDTYTLTFLPDSTVRLLIDCNRGSGPYLIDGHDIRIGPVATTRMMCPPGSMDAAFTANIDSVQHWSHNADTLQLQMNSGSMLLVR